MRATSSASRRGAATCSSLRTAASGSADFAFTAASGASTAGLRFLSAVCSNAVSNPPVIPSRVDCSAPCAPASSIRSSVDPRVGDDRLESGGAAVLGERRKLGDERVHHVVGVEVRVEDQLGPVAGLDQ